MQNSIREWIKSFVPEGEEMGDVSDSQIAGFEQTVAERAQKHRGSSRPDRKPEETPDDVVGPIAARRQIFAEWNTTLPKTLTNFAVLKSTFSKPRAKLFTHNEERDVSKMGYSQHDYNHFVEADRAERLKSILDTHIRSAERNSENPEIAPIYRASNKAKLDRLNHTRERIETMTPQEAEQEMQRYLASLSENCNWSRRLPPNIVEIILDSEDHRIKSQFETGTSEALQDYDNRENMVREDFGADTTGMETYEHENYGYLSDKDLEREISSNNMDDYGTVLVTFKKEKLRDRTTHDDWRQPCHLPKRRAALHGRQPGLLRDKQEQLCPGALHRAGIQFHAGGTAASTEHSRECQEHGRCRPSLCGAAIPR